MEIGLICGGDEERGIEKDEDNEQTTLMTDGGRAEYDRETAHDLYVKYTDALIEAVVLATLGVLVIVVGESWAMSSLTVQTAGGWMTMDPDPGLFYGSFVSTFGVVLLILANGRRKKARRIQARRKARTLAEAAFTVTVAATVLEFLKEVSEDV